MLLPGLAGAQALGIALADAGLAPLERALPLGALALVSGVACRSAHLRLGLVLLAACAGGAVALGMHAGSGGPPLRRAWEGVAEGSVEAVARTDSGWRVELRDVMAVDASGRIPRRIRLRGERVPGAERDFSWVQPGQRVRVRLRLRPPGGLRNPGRRDPLVALHRAGVGAVGRLAHPALFVRLPERDRASARIGLHALRARIGARLASSGPGGGLLQALVLGDRGGLGVAQREAFAALGLAHLLAVSGLHLVLVAACAYAGLQRVAARVPGLAARRDVRVSALLGAGLVAVGFALLAGWGVPVRRALVLLVALTAGFASRRPWSRLAPLSLAAVWILATEPVALFAPGAQLSFAASAALALGLARPGSAPRPAWVGGLRASATAVAVTAPLAAWHWGGQAPLALASNAVAVPWTAFVLLPGALAAALCAAAGDGAIAELGVAVAERAAWITLEAVAWTAARLPGSAAGPTPAPTWLFAAGLLGLAGVAAHSTRAKLALALAVGSVLALAPPREERPAPPRLVAFDVAQGDAVLVEGGQAAILVDAGTALREIDLGSRVVVPALRALGVERLDLLVASHADLDHRGGLVAVLRELPVAELWLPAGTGDERAFEALRRAAAARGVTLREQAASAAPWRRGDLVVRVLWPPAGAQRLGRNDASLVLHVEVAGRSVLLPGDLEAEGEAALVASGATLRADVLKLPHHGSRSSSSPAFLAAVSPAVAIASAPCPGRWSMPDPVVRARLRALGAALWWTGRDGAVRVGLGSVLHVGGTGRARACGTAERAR